jgi:hypothetical protein
MGRDPHRDGRGHRVHTEIRSSDKPERTQAGLGDRGSDTGTSIATKGDAVTRRVQPGDSRPDLGVSPRFKSCSDHHFLNQAVFPKTGRRPFFWTRFQNPIEGWRPVMTCHAALCLLRPDLIRAATNTLREPSGLRVSPASSCTRSGTSPRRIKTVRAIRSQASYPSSSRHSRSHGTKKSR